MPESPIERFRRLHSASLDAEEAGDFVTAAHLFGAAKSAFAAIPNVEKDGLRTEFSREGLAEHHRYLLAKARGGSLKSLLVEYSRPEMDLDERCDY